MFRQKDPDPGILHDVQNFIEEIKNAVELFKAFLIILFAHGDHRTHFNDPVHVVSDEMPVLRKEFCFALQNHQIPFAPFFLGLFTHTFPLPIRYMEII